MPYKTGAWGEQAKLRYKKRVQLDYFKNYYESKRKKIGLVEGFGSYGENIGIQLLIGSEIVRKPGFDLLWRNKRVEVKISKFIRSRRRWGFTTGRQKNKTDYFLLICMKEDKITIVKIYLIPNENIPNIKLLHINENNKDYDMFLIKRG